MLDGHRYGEERPDIQTSRGKTAFTSRGCTAKHVWVEDGAVLRLWCPTCGLIVTARKDELVREGAMRA